MLSNTWAVLRDEDNVCDNVILWDGVAPWEPPLNHWVKQLEEGSHVGIGWKWDAATNEWIDIRVPPEMPA